MSEKFDAIIVGAGPAGAAAGLALAKAGVKVAIFERGEQPGSKNMFGGSLYYTETLDTLIPDFWQIAPIERYVTQHAIVVTSTDASVSVSFSDQQFSQAPFNSITLLRATFDRWFAEKAQEAGAFLIPDTLVDEFLYDGPRIVGVKAAREAGSVYADVVLIAEGANSLLVKKAGLGADPPPTDFAVGAKEILALPDNVIEDRFHLNEKEGACYTFIGDCLGGIEGGGFLYTNKKSLSLGVVTRLSVLQKEKVSIAELVDRFKNHASVRLLIEGAVLKEYAGHLIPEGGIDTLPALYGDGVLVAGDAARFICSTGLTLKGMNFAIASGYAAAEAVKNARNTGDFSKNGLACYEKLLERGAVLPTLRTFRNAPGVLANPRIYETYPMVLCDVLRDIFKAGDQPRKNLAGVIWEKIKGRVSPWYLLKDIFRGGRAL